MLRCHHLPVALVAVGVTVSLTGCGTLGKAELRRGVESVGALAAQGQILASGVAGDRTKSTYTRVMARELGGAAQHEAEKLADATPQAGLGRLRDAAVALSSEVASLYSQIETFPGREVEGRRVVRRMGRAKAAADELARRVEIRGRQINGS